MILAGGTDLMVSAPHRRCRPASSTCGGCRAAAGCAATATPSSSAPAPPGSRSAAPPRLAHLPILAAAAREIGALQIQARGTIGGTSAPSPVGDSLPVLLALDAEIELRGPGGARRVAYASYCTGYRTTARAADELIAAVRVPVPSTTTALHWRKVGTRRAQSISKVMGAAAIRWDGDVVAEARLALGAVAAQPIRAAGRGGRGAG
ncbi:MAG: FAD binding domain-containing protein [Kofleriaceae bacterium]